ncbi:MAG: GDP-L-fucose synthase family protein [Planctomycetota bacterium]
MPTAKLSWKNKRVLVTGGAGFVGRVLCPLIEHKGARVFVPRSKDYDLTQVEQVRRCYDWAQPDYVLHLAAEVGGIGANRLHPGRYFFANMAMGLHLIEEARLRKVARFLQTGTICAYPNMAPTPFRETSLWDGFPETTNAPYGIAKKSLWMMLDAYHREYGMSCAYVLPVNLYGPEDNFHPEYSHVIPALIRKCVEARQAGAKEIVCWGTGKASREFLYVDDAARGILAAVEKMDRPDPINLGTGSEIRIRDLVTLIADLSGFHGKIVWDATKPDGQPRRCLDVTKARTLLGWSARTDLKNGLQKTIRWFGKHQHNLREIVYG